MLLGYFLIYVLPIGISLFILFFLMKAAVKSAIEDIKIDEKKKMKKDTAIEDDLIKLRDMELLSDKELEETIEVYKAWEDNQENFDQYKKYLKILDELKGREYFTNDQYNEKINMLKEQFHIG